MRAEPPPEGSRREPAEENFRRFFLRGLATLLPTLITLWLLVWAWNFLWNSIGSHIIWSAEWVWWELGRWHVVDEQPAGNIRYVFRQYEWLAQPIGVLLAILAVYFVGVLVGNLIGRTMWAVGERAVMRLPLVKAIYPAVKQVTDFVLADRTAQFTGTRVVAVQARSQGIWSIGLVTGSGYGPLNAALKGEMLTIFIPSSPTAFSGYVVIAHRESVVELPLKVEEAIKLLISGGVLTPGATGLGFAVAPSPAALAPAAEPAPEGAALERSSFIANVEPADAAADDRRAAPDVGAARQPTLVGNDH